MAIFSNPGSNNLKYDDVLNTGYGQQSRSEDIRRLQREETLCHYVTWLEVGAGCG